MFKQIVIVAIALASGSTVLAQGRMEPGIVLERMDADGDGNVTLDEFTAARESTFSKRDKNADGYLDDTDFGKRAARRAKLKEKAANLRERVDTNGDGRISREEFVNAGTPLFDRVDKDDNDILDAQELAEARAAAKSRAEERGSSRM